MKTYILDLGYIIWGPSILSLNKRDRIVVPQAVLYEIESQSLQYAHSHFEEIAQLIRDSAKKELISIEEPTELIKNLTFDLTLSDIQILSLAKDYSKENNDVAIVSAETNIRSIAKELNLRVIDRSEFTKLINESEKDEALLKKANKISRTQWKFIIWNILISLFATILFNFGWNNLELIVNTINVWATILLIIFLASFIYWFRGRYLLFYALLEIFIGFTTSVRVFYPDFNYDKLTDISFLQIIAGIYVVIRGLDNLGKSLKKTRFNSFWRWYSGIQ